MTIWTLVRIVGKEVKVTEYPNDLASALIQYRQDVIEIQRQIEHGGLTTSLDVRSKVAKFEYAIAVILYAPNWTVIFDWKIDT